ncbi:MAG: N-formylglutamate amidohydrolase [Rhodospirillales bacterium]|nr:N-formylglutamate amidohydrolase [Rhodospirillales bacterium]
MTDAPPLNGRPAIRRSDPTTTPVPLVFDSPHSGTDYPPDFGFVAPLQTLRSAEDTHVDRLFAAAPDNGATLLAALFPRSYIDVNRDLRDIDPELLDAAWPGTAKPGPKSKLGIGLIRRLAQPNVPVYDRKLTVAEVRARIENCYLPYHDELARIVDALHARFGVVWHINCHSMASRGSAMTEDGPVERPDFVLGDRDGTTCGPIFTDLVAHRLREMGYAVKINDPYKGAEIVRRYADPPARRQSLQIEINRKLYMDERTREPNAGFDKLQADMSRLIGFLAGYARAALA